MNSGCESETDTEEFEKVGQSPNDGKLAGGQLNATKPESVEVATSTYHIETATIETLTEVRLIAFIDKTKNKRKNNLF